MKRIGAALIAICMLCVCVPGVVFGSGDASVSAKLNFQNFNVDIQGMGLEPLAQINVVAVPENENPISVTEAGTAAYIGQTVADAEGSVKLSIGFRPDSKGGVYEICLIDSASGIIYRSNAFQFRHGEAMLSALEAVNKASRTEMSAALEQCREGMLLDMTEYDTLEIRKQKAAEMLYTIRPAGGFADVFAVHAGFGSCVAATAITGSETPEELLKKYGENLGIDLTLLTEDCTGEAKAYALALLSGEEYASPEELAQAYPEAVFAGRVSKAKTAGEIQTYFLDTYAEVLKLDLTEYKKLSNPVKVFSELLGGEIKGYSDARSRFNSAVANQAKAEESDGSHGGSTGGGGGSRPGGGGGAGGSAGGGTPVAPEQGGVDTTPVNPDPYTDLAGVAWARDAVIYLTEKQIISGDGDGRFRPNDSVTRAEFVKILTSAFGFADAQGSLNFADVQEGDWFASYVLAGVNAGIVRGIREDWFGAEENITRGDLTVMCRRAAEAAQMELGGAEQRTPVDADKISDYAKEAVEAFYSAGIVSGDTDGNFNPQDSATRAEAAKIVAGLLRIKEGK